jgi:hypothetical protein
MQIPLITLRPTRIVRVLTLSCIALVTASIATELLKYWGGHAYAYGLVSRFYVDDEQNLPTMFSVFILGAAAVLLALIASRKGRELDPYTTRWKVLAIGFTYMSIDEGADIHEMAVVPVRHLLGDGHLGIFYFAWVIPFGLIVAGLAIYFLQFLWSLPRPTAVRFIVAASVFLGGALGLELIGGWYADLHDKDNVGYMLLATIEETLEMAGIILFIRALLAYMTEHYPQFGIRIQEARQQDES